MEIEQLLEISVKKNASDLHILPGTRPLLRIHGMLSPIEEIPIISPEKSKELIYTLLTEPQKVTFEKKLVLEMALAASKIGNFRISIFHQLYGVGAVFRIVPEKVPTLEELSFPRIFKTFLSYTSGLILVTGPTGSGKSTTLAAMIDYINTNRSCNIITIEDPIEFIHKNKLSVFNQMQIGRDTTDFATALRASLRQDSNVILIGELRDLETMRLALTAAETGHLVLATLHASTAPIAISRFADVFPTEEKNRVRTLLSETLQAVLCQTLVKKIAGSRVAAFEVMLMTPAIRHYIRQDMPSHIESSMQTSGDKGMCTLEQYLQQLVAKRLVNAMVASNTLSSRGVIAETERFALKHRKKQ